MKVMAAVMAFVAGEAVNVSAVCRRAGCRARRSTSGRPGIGPRAGGFEERSRRPRSSPARMADGSRTRVVALRKELADAGLDHGATTIQWHLGRIDGSEGRCRRWRRCIGSWCVAGSWWPSPANDRSRRGDVSRRQHRTSGGRSTRRTGSIATGVVQVFNIIDDHSRVLCRLTGGAEATTDEAWTTFCQAAATLGSAGRGAVGQRAVFLRQAPRLRGAVRSEPPRRRDPHRSPVGRIHPQTTGKVERFQQTLKKWLRHQTPSAADLAELQAQLDQFCEIYNYERPHQGIGRVTPFTRWTGHARCSTRRPSTRASPPPEPSPARPPRTRANQRQRQYRRLQSTSAAPGRATPPP